MNTRTIIRSLFEKFEGDPTFDRFHALVDEEEDGPYTTFQHFGDFFRHLIETESSKKLLADAFEFINSLVSLKDAEWDNILRMEVFCAYDLNENLINKFKKGFSDRAFKLLIELNEAGE